MMITRNNYEEFFLLYVDHELSAADRKAVDAFVLQNPDLGAELVQLKQAALSPEASIVFENKEMLMKQIVDPSLIDMTNYENYFLLYADNELDDATRKEVESFAGRNPSLLLELSIILQTRPEPDMAVVFKNKEILYKKEERRIIALPWFRISAAAVALILLSLFVLINNKRDDSIAHITDKPNNVKGAGANKKDSLSKKTLNNLADVKAAQKKNQPAVTSAQQATLDNTEDSKKQMAVKQKIQLPSSTQYAVNTKQNKKAVNNRNSQLPAGNEKNVVVKTNPAINPVLITKNMTNQQPLNTTEQVVALNALLHKPVIITDQPADASARKEGLNYVTQAVQDDNTASNEQVFYLANTSAKKNKLRGIFRKVSRVFDRNADADDDNKHGILIGTFQIALK